MCDGVDVVRRRVLLDLCHGKWVIDDAPVLVLLRLFLFADATAALVLVWAS